MGQQSQIGKVATAVFTDSSDNFTYVVYHQTAVVKFNHEKIILDSGGWDTATTKSRMNQASNQFNLGYQVYQEKWVWYVRWCGESLEFEDGIVLDRSEYPGTLGYLWCQRCGEPRWNIERGQCEECGFTD